MRAHPDTEILRLESVSKRFGEPQLLDAVSLTIHAGERVVLLGESGSGKSTLLNLVAGLEPVDGGRILVGGVPVDGRDPDRAAGLRRERIGFVFQAFHLLPHLDAQSNVMVPLLLNGERHAQARHRAREMLATLGVGARADAMPATLSGGEQQRVAIARALVHAPMLVLADEPTGNLDAANAEKVLDLLDAHCGARGAALLMVTHSARAARVATRVLRIANARLEAQ